MADKVKRLLRALADDSTLEEEYAENSQALFDKFGLADEHRSMFVHKDYDAIQSVVGIDTRLNKNKIIKIIE